MRGFNNEYFKAAENHRKKREQEEKNKKNKYKAMYGINPSGRFVGRNLTGVIGLPQLQKSIFSGLNHNNGKALALLDSNTTNYDKPSPFEISKDLIGLVHVPFAIGYYNNEYDGYRRVRFSDVTTTAFQAALIEAHEKNNGWPLLEKPLESRFPLSVMEGLLKINNEFIVEVGHGGHGGHRVAQKLDNVYTAMSADTEVSWTEKTPPIEEWKLFKQNTWSCEYNSLRIVKENNTPCLFVSNKDKVQPKGGSRRSHRHKRNKCAKKQKKHTRKH